MEVVENKTETLKIQEKEIRIPIRLTPEKADYIKKLMFQALVDPRESYKVETIDDMEDYWHNRRKEE
jgi:hypothetical protein